MAGVYAANTLGAIVGALGASLLLVAWVGSQRTEQVLIAVVDRLPVCSFCCPRSPVVALGW